MKDQPSPPSATEAPWSKTGRKGGRTRRLPVIVASVLGLALGLFSIFALRSKSTPPQLASSSASSVASAPSAGLETVPSDAHATPLVETTTDDAAPSAIDALPAPSASAAQRRPARAPSSPGADQYTYFGGRR